MGSSTDAPLALVTGAASGIGLAIAARLVKDGYQLLAIDRDERGLGALADEHGDAVSTAALDLSALDGLEEGVLDLVGTHGSPAVLVNAAGIPLVGSALEGELDDWQRVLDVNLTAPMVMCRAVVPGMLERGDGCIVNIASVAAFRGYKQRAAYCASKAGLLGFTRALAADFAAQGIRVNAVCPGAVDTGYTKAVVSVTDDPDAARASMAARQLIGRMGTADEIAGLVSYLVSDDATFMHGAAVIIDGGRTVL